MENCWASTVSIAATATRRRSYSTPSALTSGRAASTGPTGGCTRSSFSATSREKPSSMFARLWHLTEPPEPTAHLHDPPRHRPTARCVSYANGRLDVVEGRPHRFENAADDEKSSADERLRLVDRVG